MVHNIYFYICIVLLLILGVYSPQHHRGSATTQEKWVFGLVDVSQQPALDYMEMVSRRDANTLLPIIQAHVLPGTTIYSDEWAAYKQVQNLPKRHCSCHSQPLTALYRFGNRCSHSKQLLELGQAQDKAHEGTTSPSDGVLS